MGTTRLAPRWLIANIVPPSVISGAASFAILVGAAISAARAAGAYLKDKFHRLKARRGALRAALAIAHKIYVSAYHMLANLRHRELDEAYLDQIGQTRSVANLKRRLERLGYCVILEPNAQATRHQRLRVIFVAVTILPQNPASTIFDLHPRDRRPR